MSKNALIGEKLYDVATYAYNQINDCIDRGDYDACLNYKAVSADFTWLSFVAGHLRAPWGMYLSFNEGIGTEKNPYMASLMYQIAKKLNSYDVQEKEEKNIIPDNMKPLINQLYNMIIDANKKYGDEGFEDYVKLWGQVELFRDDVKLPNGKVINDYLFKNDEFLIEVASKQISTDVESLNVHLGNVQLSGEVVNDEDNIVENPSCWDNCSIM